ncbi:polyketide cyclase dehydrase and lipid transporter [Pyrenophora seminiperda CCB06]|uniref:Polyketide cyclase dehydrase and lipid transporter n=1 Tax=Pyrenophora seminiperda CCB06 TaxID=1302712 RepID=A0A3M7MHU2_9PLEO|nr:polyketide cyclase dehydrase and lipid transporter [Pyrenophora seminiperda CCB06]
MATLKTTTRPFLHTHSTRLLHPSPTTQQRRTFLPNPFEALNAATQKNSPPQVLTAVRTLPYPSAPIYSIIADVPNYQTFLPYCQRSDITEWSAPDKQYGRRWPSEAVLTTGFGGLTESFTSRIYCIPGRYVESVGGDTETSLKPEDIAHHLEEEGGAQAEGGGQRRRRGGGGSNGLLTHLRSKWCIEPVQNNQTQVSLAVEFAFENPMYAALSGGVAPKVADFMIRAFEARAKELLEGNEAMIKADLGELDGSRLKR